MSDFPAFSHDASFLPALQDTADWLWLAASGLPVSSSHCDDGHWPRSPAAPPAGGRSLHLHQKEDVAYKL